MKKLNSTNEGSDPKVTAVIEDDEQIFEMEAQGQLMDFNSETEGKSNGSICIHSKSTQTESEDETKVFLITK